MKLTVLFVFLLGSFNTLSQKAKFFGFDDIDYYSINCPDTVLFKMDEDGNIPEFQKLLRYTLTREEYPVELTTGYLDTLTQVGFLKGVVDKNKHLPIKKIFLKRLSNDNYIHMCIHVFRDVLVFKKENEPVAVIRICFSCQEYRVVLKHGVVAKKLVRNIDYKRLKDILKN